MVQLFFSLHMLCHYEIAWHTVLLLVCSKILG